MSAAVGAGVVVGDMVVVGGMVGVEPADAG
jgi:hypothetical protein